MSKLLPELAAKGARIVVTPARRTWSLSELVGDIGAASRHHEIRWKDRIGKESW